MSFYASLSPLSTRTRYRRRSYDRSSLRQSVCLAQCGVLKVLRVVGWKAQRGCSASLHRTHKRIVVAWSPRATNGVKSSCLLGHGDKCFFVLSLGVCLQCRLLVRSSCKWVVVGRVMLDSCLFCPYCLCFLVDGVVIVVVVVTTAVVFLYHT